MSTICPAFLVQATAWLTALVRLDSLTWILLFSIIDRVISRLCEQMLAMNYISGPRLTISATFMTDIALNIESFFNIQFLIKNNTNIYLYNMKISMTQQTAVLGHLQLQSSKQ